MGAVEILIIVFAVLVVVGFIASYIVRKSKGKPTGSCAGCPYAKDCKHGCSCHSEIINLSQYKSSTEEEKIN